MIFSLRYLGDGELGLPLFERVDCGPTGYLTVQRLLQCLQIVSSILEYGRELCLFLSQDAETEEQFT